MIALFTAKKTRRVRFSYAARFAKHWITRRDVGAE